MRLKKPKFWDQKKSFISILLLPIALLIEILIFLKPIIYKKRKFNLPIICIGNIYIGGTGKTPLAILIGNQLIENKKKPTIIRKYYKSHKDEYDLIRSNFNSLIIDTNRISAIEKAIKEDYNFIILDDGFQDNIINKNLNIICFNQKQLIGNGLVMPAGPLREKFSSLKRADIVIINGDHNKDFEEKILNCNKNIKIFYSKYRPININNFKGKRLLAFAGIGNPNNFFDLLSENKLDVHKKIEFPDHYEFKKAEIVKIINMAKKYDYEIITTEKDFLRISKFNMKEINYLKVELIVEEIEKLNKMILKLND